jgi:hypothetical protein
MSAGPDADDDDGNSNVPTEESVAEPPSRASTSDPPSNASVPDGEEVLDALADYNKRRMEDAQATISTAAIGIVVLSVLQYAYMTYYFGWVWFNLPFKREYTQAFSPPAPGPLVDARYGLQWLVIALMAFNALPPLTAAWLLHSPENTARKDIYRWTGAFAVLVCVAVGLWSLLYIYVFQNNSTFSPFSVANEVNFCCKYWGSVFADHGCHNFNDCVDLPPIPTISLHTNPYFVKHLWACAFLTAFSVAHVFMSGAQSYYQQNYNEVIDALGEQEDGGAKSSGYPRTGPFSYYQTRPTQYTRNGRIALHVFNCIYLVMALCYLVFLLLVLTPRYSHEWPPTGPIGIQDGRVTFQVIGIIMSSTVILIPFLVLLAMWAQGNYPGLVTILVVFMLLATCHVLAFMTMITTRGTANLPGVPNNLANHPLRCCAPDVYSDPTSQCDNAIACVLPFDGYPQWTTLPTSSADIPYNSTHTGMFVMMIFFLILDFIIAVLLFVTFLGRAVLKNVNNTFATNVGALVDAIDQYIEAPLRKLGSKGDTSTQNKHRDEDIESARSPSSPTKHGKKWARPNPLAATATTATSTTTTRRKKHGASIPPSSSSSPVDNVPGLTAIASAVHIPSVAVAKTNRNKEL